MTPAEIISITAASLSLGSTLYLGIFRMAKIESRVEILWNFLLKRVVGDTVASGLLRNESPLTIDIVALERHKPLLAEIKEWYGTQPESVSDLELFQRMEQKYSDKLTAICMEENILPGGASVAMLFLLRPQSKLFDGYNAWGQK